MRFKEAAKQGKNGSFAKDWEETSVLYSVQSEVRDRELADEWKSRPDAKPVPRAGAAKQSLKALDHYGLSALSDVVAHADLMGMRDNDDGPKEHDRARLGELHDALKAVPREPDIKSSFQYLAQKESVLDDSGGVWQVKINRRRRQQRERMSREHHEEEEDAAELIDEHGNLIVIPIDATRRPATSKELKRIKKATATRRRNGEDVFTDDELEAANLEPPVAASAKAAAKKLSPKVSSVDSSQSDWDLMYLEPLPGSSPVATSPDKSFDSDGSWMLAGPGAVIQRVPSSSLS